MFGYRRFTDDKGVSQPCQVRFIHYFEGFYKNIVISPQIKILKRIKLMAIPWGGCRPYFTVFLTDGLQNYLKYDNKNEKKQVKYYTKEDKFIELSVNKNLNLFGNIMIKFNNMGTLSNSDLFRVTFNTAFIPQNNILKLHRYEISPEKMHKDFDKFPEDFEVILEFEDFCQGKINSVTKQVERPPCNSTTTKLD